MPNEGITLPGTDIKIPTWGLIAGIGGIAAVLLLKRGAGTETPAGSTDGLMMSEFQSFADDLKTYFEGILAEQHTEGIAPVSKETVPPTIPGGVPGPTPNPPENPNPPNISPGGIAPYPRGPRTIPSPLPNPYGGEVPAPAPPTRPPPGGNIGAGIDQSQYVIVNPQNLTPAQRYASVGSTFYMKNYTPETTTTQTTAKPSPAQRYAQAGSAFNLRNRPTIQATKKKTAQTYVIANYPQPGGRERRTPKPVVKKPALYPKVRAI